MAIGDERKRGDPWNLDRFTLSEDLLYLEYNFCQISRSKWKRFFTFLLSNHNAYLIENLNIGGKQNVYDITNVTEELCVKLPPLLRWSCPRTKTTLTGAVPVPPSPGSPLPSHSLCPRARRPGEDLGSGSSGGPWRTSRWSPDYQTHQPHLPLQALDRQLHTCIYDRKLSQLPEVPGLENIYTHGVDQKVRPASFPSVERQRYW